MEILEEYCQDLQDAVTAIDVDFHKGMAEECESDQKRRHWTSVDKKY